MKKVQKIFSGLTASALLFLSGCGSTSSAESEETKVLNWFASGEVTTMDSGKTYDTISGSQLAYFNDTLYKLDENEEAQPWLATDDPVLSDDGLTATITIRDDAYFSNGENITAADIVYAAQRVVDPETGSQAASNLAWIANAEEITAGELSVDELGIVALSDYELQITLKSATPYLKNELTSVLLSPVSESFVESVGDQYALSADNLLSSGPYVLQDWDGTNTSWTFVKNEYYWNADEVYFDQINMQVVKDDATGVSLYEAGELDGVSISGEYISVWSDTEDYLQVETLRMTNLEMGISSNEDLQNLNIRKALSLVIDREELCESILNGSGTPAVGVIPNGIASNPTTGASVEEDFGNLVEYDVELAQEYFAQGLEELGKDSITLTLLTSDTDESIKIGTYLQSVFETNLPGLTIDVQNVTSSVRFELMMSYDFDLALGGWSGDFDPTSYVKQFETSYEHNHGQWVSEELTELVNALETEDGNDFELRWEHLKEANQYLIDNQVVINLYQTAQNFLVNPDLEGVTTHVLGSNAVDVAYAYFAE